jgi:MFS family permease
MYSRRLKTGYFILEGLNSFATVYYFYYLYFFLHQRYGFGNQANLAVAALSGASYALFAWGAGKFAQSFGYFTALKLGFSVMILAMGCGLSVHSPAAHIWVMVLTVFGMSFTWPTLEALVSEREPRGGLQHMVGLYNVIWAATAAMANFSGGAMLEKLGSASLFYVPMAIEIAQLGLTLWLQSRARKAEWRRELEVGAGRKAGEADSAEQATENSSPALSAGERGKAQSFLRMAWLANPFAYIAINTTIAAMPGVAGRLHLSTMVAGFCASTWCFARLAAFYGLWKWAGWHYRFRWLVTSYLLLIGAFASILLAPSLAVVVLAQIVFGGAVGLIYYSSLYYSMDVGETKGEHGGIHEAVIGLGNCAGPAVGAAALYYVPQMANSGALAVTGLLVAGLGGLLFIWRKGK